MFNRYTPVPPISSPDATDGSAQDVLTERWKQRIATLKDKEDCDDAVQANSITLAGSELVRSWFEADSCQIPLH